MGKRSSFERRKNDEYQTPLPPVLELLPHLSGIRTFAEPCRGEGRLVGHLESLGYTCAFASGLNDGFDAITSAWPNVAFDAIITNPPWTRKILHPMILRFQSIAPTWLLFDADWAHTGQCLPFMDQCSLIVSVGRVKWIEDSESTGKDNAAWYRFDKDHKGGPRFFTKGYDPEIAELV